MPSRRDKLLALAASERSLGHEAAARNIEAVAASLRAGATTRSPAAAQNQRAYFFGCLILGHHLYGPRIAGQIDRVDIVPASSTPWKLSEIDGNAQPNSALYAHTWQVPGEKQPLGVARLHHRAGWTMLSFWDRSMDTRYGSNGNFILEGTHDFTAACSTARSIWPELWERITSQPGWPSKGEIQEVRE